MKKIRFTEKETIVTTTTQPQLNSKVGFDTKMTLDHHPPTHPHKLNVSNISAVTDFYQTFKVGFWDQQQQ